MLAPVLADHIGIVRGGSATTELLKHLCTEATNPIVQHKFVTALLNSYDVEGNRHVLSLQRRADLKASRKHSSLSVTKRVVLEIALHFIASVP